VAELSHQCRDLGDSDRHWQLHFFAAVGKQVGADAAGGGEVGGFDERHPYEISLPVDWGFDTGFDITGWLRARELLKTDPAFSPLLTRYLCRCGQVRGIALRRSTVPPDDGGRTADYRQVYEQMGVDHSLCCFRYVPDGRGEVFGGVFYRATGRPDFSAHDVKLIEEDFAAIAPLVGGPLARSEEPSPAGLTPRGRDVLRCVLEGDSAKQIAARLGISVNTANEYLRAVFHHFHVGTRPELMARWIRRGWGAKFAWAEG
jgi:DNA-binding CsgD family transcriptional regulator